MKTKTPRRLTRRTFLGQSSAAVTAALAAPLIVPSSLFGAGGVAPSNRATIGFIGTGDHGTDWNLPRYLKQPDAKVVIVCDVDREHMEFAKEKVDEFYKNKDCAMTTDFREVLARLDIDAVMISTPDHWQTLISVLALPADQRTAQ